MSRRSFIEENGATCNNWRNSWSFVNHSEKFVIFGASSVHEAGDVQLILSKNWSVNLKGRRVPGYAQSIEHIKLIEKSGYQLKTFRQVEETQNEETGSVRLRAFDRVLEDRLLDEREEGWFAVPVEHVGDTSRTTTSREVYFLEGYKVRVTSWAIERNPEARKKCIEYHQPICAVCEFNFEKAYGEVGKGFIHVHHKYPISEANGPRKVNPIEDLIPVCPNCHAVIHRGPKLRTVEEVKALLNANKIKE